MGRSTSSKASKDNDGGEKISITEQVRLYGIYIEEQKVALEDARKLIEKLQRDFNQLRVERDIIQQEAFASTEFYEHDIKQKKELIQELETKLENKENENVSIKKQWQDELAATLTAAKMEKAELINHIGKIEKELYTLQHFSEKKAQLEAKLAAADAENVQLVEKHGNELAELERKYIEQGINMKKDFEKSLDEIHRKLNSEIEDRVGQRVRDILAEVRDLWQNERLGNEIRMHVEITGNLQREIDIIQADAAGVTRDIDLLREADGLHMRRSSTQARVIAESNLRLVRLEQSIGNVVRQYGSERRALEDEHLKSIADFQLEKQARETSHRSRVSHKSFCLISQTMRRILQTKAKELRRVRQLAQQVLRERGEVESFLIESLHTVVEEIKKSKKQQTPPILTKAMLRACSEQKKPDASSKPATSSSPPSPSSQKSSSARSAQSAKSAQSTQSAKSAHSVDFAAPPAAGASAASKPNRAVNKLVKSKSQLEGETQLDVMGQMEEVPVRLEAAVDVSQLSWGDKEKVLRYLFAKINSAHQIPGSVVMSQARYPELFDDDDDAEEQHLFGSVSDAGRVLV
ncbi:hypothetical protein SELMODRAFT_413484 [Selaginella moellendorffii]|uniref:Uncharacterized protein n=1 Tax=Selaginella moellendorffii TaxID=88036 RepID=D8RPM2_SELML|nr:hypothetical protein SELMODRAFT_413484 [Selaginella moellendorffii]